MTCDVCQKETDHGFGFMGVGLVCSEPCKEELLRRQRELEDELAAEPISEMPDLFTVYDFERWAFKVAVQAVRGFTPEQREKVAKMSPLFLMPTELAQELKERIIRQLPRKWVTVEDARGHARMFHGGTFQFPNPVPKAVITKAAEDADIIEPRPDRG